MVKSAAEIEELALAGAAIDRVHARMGEWLRVGRTEAEVGADIAAAILAEGHVAVDFTIVGSGPNGASPHHELSGRTIEAGDVVVVDIGGETATGYRSDCTRTYVVGRPGRRPRSPSGTRVLQAAQEACDRRGAAGRDRGGRRRGGPGGDRATPARASTSSTAPATASGWTPTRRPTSWPATTLPLEPGMAFSVEPGIYLAGPLRRPHRGHRRLHRRRRPNLQRGPP